ncbi:MAG: phosphonate ABC transporter substrate-binding protein [Clostridia bacterium]|nr:phosphonate ABC transporter substrate-binding protein [Clostridia bacterium]
MRKKQIILYLIMICLILFMISCTTKTTDLTIGLIPSNDPAKLLEKFKPIEAYLEKEINIEVNVVVPTDYLGLINSMKKKTVDIGWYGPFSYVIAERELDLEPMVVESYKGVGTSYYSLIIARKDSKIRTIDDLKGKTYAFVDPGSTSGFVIPSALFISRNIDTEKYFKETIFSGNHDAVVMDVLNGKADAGSISDVTFQKLTDEGTVLIDDLIIIWKSDEIPNSPFIARADLDKDIKDKFKTAMLSIHENNMDAVKVFDLGIDKYVEFEYNDYNNIRNIAKILGDDFVMKNFLKNEE